MKWAFCVAVLLATATMASARDIAAICTEKSGAKTASGEPFLPEKLTAAHRTFPFGTLVRVTNLNNGRTVVVRINDRGPFSKGRVIDVTPAAAAQLHFSGLAPVALVVATPAH
jgi:rare lipoprotein A